MESFDTSGSGIRPGSSPLTNFYIWNYDSAGRLTREVLDSSDDSLDQTESFLMDLVGNRIRRTLDKPGTANDTTDIYTYEASDRILNELRYSGLFATSSPNRHSYSNHHVHLERHATNIQDSLCALSVLCGSIHELWTQRPTRTRHHHHARRQWPIHRSQTSRISLRPTRHPLHRQRLRLQPSNFNLRTSNFNRVLDRSQ